MPLPAHRASSDHPAVPCNAQFRYPRSPLDSARGTGAGSACPGDCAPRGNVPHIAVRLGAAASLRTLTVGQFSHGVTVFPKHGLSFTKTRKSNENLGLPTPLQI